MAAAIDKRFKGDGPHSPRVRQIGLIASSAATAALFVTYFGDNRSLGFGRSVTETEQNVLLVVASLLMIGFAAANVFSRRRSRHSSLNSTNSNRSVTASEGSGNDEV